MLAGRMTLHAGASATSDVQLFLIIMHNGHLRRKAPRFSGDETWLLLLSMT